MMTFIHLWRQIPSLEDPFASYCYSGNWFPNTFLGGYFQAMTSWVQTSDLQNKINIHTLPICDALLKHPRELNHSMCVKVVWFCLLRLSSCCFIQLQIISTNNTPIINKVCKERWNIMQSHNKTWEYVQ